MAYQEFGVDRVRQQQELHAVGWALLCRSLPYEPASWDDVTRHEAAAALARAARFIAMIDAQPPAGGGEDGRRVVRPRSRPGRLPYPVLAPLPPAALN